MQQQSEQMQQQQELMHSINSLKDTTLDDISRSQTDLSARLERLERASPDLNPVELRTNPSDGNFVFHAVPTNPSSRAVIATRPSITSDTDKETDTSFRPLTFVSHSLSLSLSLGT